MERQFDITAEFESDLQQLSATDRLLIAQSIDEWSGKFIASSDKVPSHIFFQPAVVTAPVDLASSLYGMRVGEGLRLVLTVEHDPLFGHDTWTLIRAVPRAHFDAAFQSAVDVLYPHLQDESIRHG